MSEQKLYPVMSLNSIENIEPLDDFAAESINAGSFSAQLDNQDGTFARREGLWSAEIDLSDSSDYSKAFTLQVTNESSNSATYNVALHDGDSGDFLAYTHRGPLSASGNKGKTRETWVDDEIRDALTNGHTSFVLRIVKQ